VPDEPPIANEPEQELAVRPPRLDPQTLEQLLQRREAPPGTSFEVRFVDEIGQGISGLTAVFSLERILIPRWSKPRTGCAPNEHELGSARVRSR